MEGDVASNFAERTHTKAERRGDFRQAVAMTGELRQGKLQLFGEIGGDVQSSRAGERHSPDCASKLKNKATRLHSASRAR